MEYYVETSYDDGTAPGTSSQWDDGQWHAIAGTTNHLPGIHFISRKRVVPTVTLWSGNGAAGKATEFAGSSDNANTGGSSSWVGQSGGGYITYSGGNFTAGSVYGTHYLADARH